ncbi:hypothetical protein AVEN_29112-1 [Araneus ventricosus]|uniref:Uncharacterized protein n=1 Tax=Araneus ventricosus TaxID=182803 RepID=A0A4Y2AK32_ARAVE|nr:hypothetical protein AVEN_29112-1 [Araneus ventricosus]
MVGENSQDAGLSAKNEMEKVMKSTLHRIHMEINERFFRLNEMDLKFGFLLNVEELCYGHNTDVLLENCKNLGDFYSRDFNDLELHDEILDCRMLLPSRLSEKIKTPEELLQFIVSYGDESVFTNLRIALQILLTIATGAVFRTGARGAHLVPRDPAGPQNLFDIHRNANLMANVPH